jgi:hypothetical protein
MVDVLGVDSILGQIPTDMTLRRKEHLLDVRLRPQIRRLEPMLCFVSCRKMTMVSRRGQTVGTLTYPARGRDRNHHTVTRTG